MDSLVVKLVSCSIITACRLINSSFARLIAINLLKKRFFSFLFKIRSLIIYLSNPPTALIRFVIAITLSRRWSRIGSHWIEIKSKDDSYENPPQNPPRPHRIKLMYIKARIQGGEWEWERGREARRESREERLDERREGELWLVHWGHVLATPTWASPLAVHLVTNSFRNSNVANDGIKWDC